MQWNMYKICPLVFDTMESRTFLVLSMLSYLREVSIILTGMFKKPVNFWGISPIPKDPWDLLKSLNTKMMMSEPVKFWFSSSIYQSQRNFVSIAIFHVPFQYLANLTGNMVVYTNNVNFRSYFPSKIEYCHGLIINTFEGKNLYCFRYQYNYIRVPSIISVIYLKSQ